jgi:glycerol uptake facilitator-like aquaporin
MPFRTIVALYHAVRIFLATLWRITRQLFHETAGALFLLFSVSGASGAWRAWRHASSAWIVALCLLFAAMMAAFSATSFRDAHRVR